ncbi:NADH-quinone oxidoreductase subunit C [uncultured Jatrophihabitans sp.]|uniref:NADH-quinone oxidoreductase subunit C n=1 Tax=uncultured Jatrophihabitans sp. TaxID=1610747 RepID=UPI0035C9E68C
MSSPTERPVAEDSAPDQAASDVARATVGTGAAAVTGDTADSPYGIERQGMFGVAGSGDTSGFGGLVREPWTPPAAERPYGSYFDEIVDALRDAYADFDAAVLKVVVDRGELTLHIAREHLLGVAEVLRNDPSLRFELCSNVSGVDYLGSANRLHAVANLTSMTYRRRVRLEVAVSVEDPHVPSLTPLYPTADWQERETFDMFGIVYDGHPALTRILMPDDWDGHPQRKDYPLGGIPVQYKGATIPPPDQRRAYK